MKMNNKKYICKRLRLLFFLVDRGFTKYEVMQDPTTTKNYNWFIFENSDELQKAVAEFFAPTKIN